MRRVIIPLLLALCVCVVVRGRGPAPSRPQPHFRVGKAPKPEFKVGGKAYRIDPAAASTKQVRALPSEHFNPITRPHRVEQFYRDALKDHYEETVRLKRADHGPFRHEFIHWARRWPAAARARWAWHHRAYIEEALWNEWMAESAFAAEIAALQAQNAAPVVGYLPPEYADTSPVFVYNDEFLNAAYNPMPFLAVLTLKSLKPDEKTDWIGTATADALVVRLSSTPGLFLADRDQVAGVLRDPKLPALNAAEPGAAAQVGKALDVEQVIAGSYVVDGDQVLLTLRIVDVQTGAVQGGVSKAISRDHLLDKMPEVASSLTTALGFQPQELPPQGSFEVTYSPGTKHTVVSVDGMVIRRRGDHGEFNTYAFERNENDSVSLTHSAGYEIWLRGADGVIIERWKSKSDHDAGMPPPLVGKLEPTEMLAAHDGSRINTTTENAQREFHSVGEVIAVIPPDLGHRSKANDIQLLAMNDALHDKVRGQQAKLSFEVMAAEITPDGGSKGKPRLHARPVSVGSTSLDLYCYFDEASAKDLARVKPTSGVTVKGRITRCDLTKEGNVTRLHIDLKNCELVRD